MKDMHEISSNISSFDVFVISDEAAQTFTCIVYSVLCQRNDVFDIVNNVSDIMCFIKQGFKDSNNISPQVRKQGRRMFCNIYCSFHC